MLKCLEEYSLVYCGDSVEWCPVDGYKTLLVCGSYELQPDSSSRVGKIDLFKYENTLQLIQEIHLESGLLDAKWATNSNNGTPLLAVALSSGYLNIYKLVDNKLTLGDSLEVCCTGMALAIDWSTGVKPNNEPKLIVSQSNGSISIVQIKQDGLITLDEIKAHSYEAWAAAFNYWDNNIIYSGGDDCKLNVYDLRNSTLKPVHTELSHSVGITSIQCNQKYEGYLASSSYEDVRVWKTSKVLLECVDTEDMKGGSWRVKWNASGNCRKLAVAAMHDGFNVISYIKADGKSESMNEEDIPFSRENSKYKKKIDYKEPHGSLGYGIDWSYQDCNLLAACSFYDKKLTIAQLS